MNHVSEGRCPVCGQELSVVRLACPGCRAEFPVERPLSRYDCLSPADARFLESFLRCQGNLKAVQEEMELSYFVARRRLQQLLQALGLADAIAEEHPAPQQPENGQPLTESVAPTGAPLASDIIRNKLMQNGGQAVVISATGKPFSIQAGLDGRTFLSPALPISPPYEYTVFDVIVRLLVRQGGRARKGNGRNYKLGERDCTLDTVVGAIAAEYAGKKPGDSVYDPVFLLAAVLEWADIAENRRGYLQLTPSFQRMQKGE